MIRSFRSKALRLFAQKGEAKGLSVPNTRRVRQVLLALEAAGEPDGLNQPGFRFHRLKGERRGTYGVDCERELSDHLSLGRLRRHRCRP